MAQVVVYLAEYDAQLGHISLLIGFVQVLPQRLGERLFPLADCFTQCFERVPAELQVYRRSVGKELPLCGNHARNSVGRCVLHIF